MVARKTKKETAEEAVDSTVINNLLRKVMKNAHQKDLSDAEIMKLIK